MLNAIQCGIWPTGTDVTALRLSDQEILGLAKFPHAAGTTYADLSPFVQFEGVAAAPGAPGTEAKPAEAAGEKKEAGKEGKEDKKKK